ncbi:unnamed protein product [Effrenium voratum]|nr:unnamed protein product [Effrenium voratum]
MASRKRACSLAVALTFLSVRLCFLPPNAAKPIDRRIAPRRQAAAVLLLGAAPAEAMPSLADEKSNASDFDRLGSMLETKWEKVKPRCTSVGSMGIKAGYGVSKKQQLESIVRCDEEKGESEGKEPKD